MPIPADGIDRLEFQVATNPGEPIRPMSAIASGGETSRIVLAVKSALKDGRSHTRRLFSTR